MLEPLLLAAALGGVPAPASAAPDPVPAELLEFLADWSAEDAAVLDTAPIAREAGASREAVPALEPARHPNPENTP